MSGSPAEPAFDDRRHAGSVLADALRGYEGRDDVVVIGLARGGVPVATEVARALGAPLDVLVVRKLGMPGHEELAMGAIGPGGVRVLNEDVVAYAAIGADAIDRVEARERRELERRERVYRGGRQPVDLRERTVVLVDDGIATGATVRAAIAAVGAHGAREVLVATPTASREAVADLRRRCDGVVAVRVPERFGAVGEAYRDFGQTDDEEVRAALAAHGA